MDPENLKMHNKIQEWGQMYTLGADGTINKTTKLIAYLPAHKLEQIERWRKDVKKNTKKKLKPSQYHDWTHSGNPKFEKRIISANGSLRKIPQDNGIMQRVTSAKPYNRTDLFSVTNHLTETSLHYTAQREQLHKGNTSPSDKQSIQIYSYEQSHNGTVPDDIEDNTTQVLSVDEISDDKDVTIQHDLSIDKDPIFDEKSDKVDLESLGSLPDMANNRGHTIQFKDQTMVSTRSMSNQLLNIISIDDCKRALMLRNKTSSPAEKSPENVQSDTTKEKKVILNGCESKMSKLSGITDKGDTRAETRTSRRIHFDGTNVTSKSGFSDKHHKARLSTALDHIINDRKVMNDMDKNFDVRIESVTGRLVLEKPKETKRFRKMNTALRQHIDNIMNDQGRRVTQKHYEHNKNEKFVPGAGGMNRLTEKITNLANSLSKGENTSERDDGISKLQEKLASLSKSMENEEKFSNFHGKNEKRESLTNSVTLPPMPEAQDLESVDIKRESPVDLSKYNHSDTYHDIKSRHLSDSLKDNEVSNYHDDSHGEITEESTSRTEPNFRWVEL